MKKNWMGQPRETAHGLSLQAISPYFIFRQREEFMKAFAQSHMENTGLDTHSFPFTSTRTCTAG